MKKTIFILCLVIIMLLSIYNVTYAISIDDIISGGDNFINAGQNENHVGFKWEGIKDASDLMYNTLLILGIIIALIVAAYLGIKFMTSSVEEQAKVKESLIPFIVGCVIIFGAFGIWKLVTNIVENIQTSQTVNLPTITDRDRYKYGYDQGVDFIQGGPIEEEIDAEFEWAQKQYNNATDPNQKEYYRGYLAGLNT